MGHILVVEDEPELARLLSRLLQTKGFNVSEAASGSAGLRAAANLDPDLMILDLMLPDMRGEDVLVELMAARPTAGYWCYRRKRILPPRWAFSSAAPLDYMAKPFSTAELLARIRLRMRPDKDTPPPSAQRSATFAGPDCNWTSRARRQRSTGAISN